MQRAGAPSPGEELAARGWMVPFSVIVAVLAGGAAASVIRFYVNPSGEIQNTLSTPVAQYLDTENVALLFGAPFSALVAAIIPYFGFRGTHGTRYTIIGAIAGIAIFAAVGAAAPNIGAWWLDSVPTDTNRAAALFGLLLAPVGTLALVLTAVAPLGRLPIPRVKSVEFHGALGAVLGTVMGSLVSTISAALTWAISCPQNGSASCFSLSSVISSAFLLGAVIGVWTGAAVGVLAWMLRPRTT